MSLGSLPELQGVGRLRIPLQPKGCRGVSLELRRSPSEFTSGLAASPRPRFPATVARRLPWSLSPLPCLPTWGSGCFQAPATTAGAFAPPGFLDLLALSSAPCLPALSHAGSTLGVLPSRAFLLRCSRTLSPAPLPSCRRDALLPHRLPPTFRFLGVLRARFATVRTPLAFRALLHIGVCHVEPAV
jgi:hypothetical protein